MVFDLQGIANHKETSQHRSAPKHQEDGPPLAIQLVPENSVCNHAQTLKLKAFHEASPLTQKNHLYLISVLPTQTIYSKFALLWYPPAFEKALVAMTFARRGKDSYIPAILNDGSSWPNLSQHVKWMPTANSTKLKEDIISRFK